MRAMGSKWEARGLQVTAQRLQVGGPGVKVGGPGGPSGRQGVPNGGPGRMGRLGWFAKAFSLTPWPFSGRVDFKNLSNFKVLGG